MGGIRFAVFDYNGTLPNDTLIGYKVCNYLLKFYGVPEISLQRFRETFTTPWIDFYAANGVPREKINVAVHQKKFQQKHNSLVKRGLKLNEGVIETLDFLKSRRIVTGILSSRNIDDLTDELIKLEIFSMFDVVIGENSIIEDGVRAEKQTERLIERLEITDLSKVLYVGDMVPDIKIARKYGFKSGIVTSSWQTREKLLAEKPDYVFEKFTDIKSIFK